MVNKQQMTKKIKFGYFDFMARGHIARLLLAYTKTEYEDVKYTFTRINDWVEVDKKQLGLDFPSLPYLIDGSFKLTESKAIERYILNRAGRTDLLGRNIKEKAVLNNIEGVLRDVLNGIFSLFPEKQNFQQKRKAVFETLSPKLTYLNEFINNNYFFLKRPTYPDFILTVMFTYLKAFYPHEYNQWVGIERVWSSVNALPQIKSYYSSTDSVKGAFPRQRSSDPRFSNLPPLNDDLKREEVYKAQNVLLSDRESSVEIISRSQSEQESSRQLVYIQSSQSKEQEDIYTLTSQQLDQLNEHKQWLASSQSTVQQFQKAPSITQTKSVSQSSVRNQKSTIVTPSKIQESQKGKESSSIPWKINQENKQKSQSDVQNQSNDTKTDVFCLGYWGIRGLGQVQRHLLQYCNVQFQQKIYAQEADWFNGDKFKLNLPFPNLPYLITPHLKLTQSLSIDRYIIRVGKKPELLGKNLKDQTYIENIVKVLSDLFKQIRKLCFIEDPQQDKHQEIYQSASQIFVKIEQFVEGKPLTLEYLSWADFYIAQLSYYIQKIYPQLFGKFKFLKDIRESIVSEKQVRGYYQRTNAVKGPFMPPTAKIFF